MTIFLMFIAFAGGFAACWFGKDFLIMSYDGTTNFVRRTQAKLDKIRETL